MGFRCCNNCWFIKVYCVWINVRSWLFVLTRGFLNALHLRDEARAAGLLSPGLLTIAVHAERRRAWRQRRKHFSRYSKWHRLNQEVKKTTKKNKLDKFHHLCHFEADLGSAATRSRGVWIGRAKHIDGKPKSKELWKEERHIGSCPVLRCVLGSLS